MFTEKKIKVSVTWSFNSDFLSGLINSTQKYANIKILKGKE